MSTSSRRTRQKHRPEQEAQQPGQDPVVVPDEPDSDDSGGHRLKFKRVNVEGEFIPPGGCNSPDPESDLYGWHSTAAPAKGGQSQMVLDGYSAPFTEYIDKRSIPGLPNNVLRDTPPPPLNERPAQLRSRYTGDHDFLVQGTKNEWNPFKTHSDSKGRYSGPAFPEPRGGWTGNEWHDFRKSVLEHWKGPNYSREELESVAEQLWKGRANLGTAHWNEFKVPEGTVLETGPPNEQAEERQKKLLDAEFGSSRKEWVYRPPGFGESAGQPPQQVVETENRSSGGGESEKRAQAVVRRGNEVSQRGRGNASDPKRKRRPR